MGKKVGKLFCKQFKARIAYELFPIYFPTFWIRYFSTLGGIAYNCEQFLGKIPTFSKVSPPSMSQTSQRLCTPWIIVDWSPDFKFKLLKKYNMETIFTYEDPAQPVIFVLVCWRFVVGCICSSSRDDNSKF